MFNIHQPNGIDLLKELTGTVLLVAAFLVSPLARADYEADYEAASDLWNTDKAAAIEAFVELAGKAQTSAQAAECLQRATKLTWYHDRKDFERSMSLARQIPIESISQATQMWVLNQHGKRDELLERFANAPIETWPLDVRGEAFRIRGNAWRERGDGTNAIRDLQGAARFISFDLWKAGSYLDLGDTYRDLLGRDDEAIAAYREAFQSSQRLQTRVPATRSVADLLVARGEADAAVAELEKVNRDTARTGRYALDYLRALGHALAAADRRRDAVAAYRDALGVDGLSDAARAEIQGAIEELMLGSSEDVILAAAGMPPCQVVLPDAIPSAVGAYADSETVLRDGAAWIRSAFETNGFAVTVVTESTRDPARPAIYLGATQFARDHGMDLAEFTGWTYVHRVIDGNLVIAGNDRPEGPRPTLKGVADFLRTYARVRVVDPTGRTEAAYLPTPVIAVPAELDRTVTPHLHVLSLPAPETGNAARFAIANNYFPAATAQRPDPLPACDPWTLVTRYGKTACLDLGTAGGALTVAPQCTPLTAARLAGACIAADVEDVFLEGFTNTPALSAPVRYLFGRMFDPSDALDAKDLQEEYIEAAFRESAAPMRRFFDTLYHPLQLYNAMPRRYTDIQGRTRAYIENEPARWLGLLYPADVVAGLEAHLVQAEEQAETPDVRKRLCLVRTEFDRLRRMATRVLIEQAAKLSLPPSSELR